jgi:NlpC/P60 family putative phage cell wall peptidase
MTEPRITGGDVVRAARAWLGTPYRHQGMRRGVGCDCLGLIRGVWHDLTGDDTAVQAYAVDWADHAGPDAMLEAARRHCGAPVTLQHAQPGDIVLFRWLMHLPARHAGILTTSDHFIHAYEQAAVVESPLVHAWRRRIAAVFRFPGVE